jgi:UDP-N-acetylmuramate dehydrogenase
VALKKYTWFGVGGPAEVMFFPEDAADLSVFLQNKPSDIEACVIGGGSNLLVRDGGIKGVVIKLDSPFFKKIEVSENKIRCYGGVHNTTLKKTLCENQIGGLEFLCSVPGTIGGSVKTNAGCFGKCIGDVLISATVVDHLGKIFEVEAKDLNLSYRESRFPQDWIIVALTFKTEFSPSCDITKILEEHAAYRRSHQPCNVKTAGSTFKNPQGFRAWELIKQAGCDALSVGDAKVSEKHCNFLVNTGNASAEDIEKLGDEIVRRVKEKTSVTLEWEVKKIGVRP